MLTQTLTKGLEQYGIGQKIRALRLNKKLSLAQLGEHSGLSPALLSKIERGQLFPTLPTLLRVALVFGVGLEHFFVQSSARPLVSVVRRDERLRLPDHPNEKTPSYFFESLDFPVSDRLMEAYYAEFPVDSKPSAPHRHEGAELVYILKGQLTLNVESEDVALGEGDAVYFDSSVPHSYRREGRSACSAIVIVSPR
jgi:transcriptional regulator with XRE-family HTH domain